MKLKHALLLAGTFAIASCGGDSSTEPNGVSGSMSFSYQMAGSAPTTYSANGQIPLTVGNGSNLGTNAWAAGASSQTQGYTVIGAVIPRTSTTWDVTQIVVTRTTVGATDISADCGDTESTNCTGLVLLLSLNPNGDATSSTCFLNAGTVVISAISSTNITGSFSGTGICVNGTTFAQSSFSVTNGTFNVGVSSQLLL